MLCKNPIISVIMGVYYRSSDTSTLGRSVRSILAQTFSDFELLVCDDGSSPETIQLLDRLSVEDSRVKLVRVSGSYLLAYKLNVCLRAAEGQYIARMDDDDFSHPDRFKRQLDFLHNNPKLAFVGCNVDTYDGGKKNGERVFPEFPEVKDFYFTQPFIHPTLMFRRDVLERVGGYSEDKRCVLCEDYDLLLRIYAAGERGANLQEFLFDYTVSGAAKGNRKMRHRWNEAVTRWRRFKDLGILPRALPYVVKPLAVGLVPKRMLRRLKEQRRPVQTEGGCP